MGADPRGIDRKDNHLLYCVSIDPPEGVEMTKDNAIEHYRPIEELDLVRTLEPLRDGDLVVPSGAVGTIVFVHEEGQAFEVEFVAPIEAVVSVYRRQIEAA